MDCTVQTARSTALLAASSVKHALRRTSSGSLLNKSTGRHEESLRYKSAQSAPPNRASNSAPVTADNFIRAESDAAALFAEMLSLPNDGPRSIWPRNSAGKERWKP
jgi:hypothetical protein